jgi:polyprenyl-phospho-N-acetylgalactosaminyl synthase
MAAYNEAETVGEVIQLTRSLGFIDEIIVIDDQSRDGTAKIASNQRCTVIKNSSRLGQTKSLKRGLSRANGQIIITIDSDMDNLPSDIPILLEHKINSNSDIVIGKRSSIPRISEKIMSKMLYKFTGVTDTLSGFRVISKHALEVEEFDDVDTWGALFYLKCKRKGLKVSDSPITTPIRRSTARIGGRFSSNFKISKALLRCLLCILRIIK